MDLIKMASDCSKEIEDRLDEEDFMEQKASCFCGKFVEELNKMISAEIADHLIEVTTSRVTGKTKVSFLF